MDSPPQLGHFDRVEIYTDHTITNAVGLSHGELLLVALLNGGDYDMSCSSCAISVELT